MRLVIRFLMAISFVVLAATLVVPRVAGGGEGSIKGSKADLLTFKSLLDHFRLHCGRFPTTEEGLDALWSAPPVLKGRWKRLVSRPVGNDHWGHPYLYRSTGSNHFRIICLGADGKLGGDEENAETTVEE